MSESTDPLHPRLPAVISIDGWTSDNLSHYIGIFAYFVDKLFRRRTLLLSIQEVSAQKADDIAANIAEVSKEFDLLTIWGIVGDTTAVNPCTARLAGLKFFPCLAHVLQLGAKNLYGETSVAHFLKRVSDIISIFRRSPKASMMLRASLQDLIAKGTLNSEDVGKKRAVKDLNQTRWASTCKALKRVLVFDPAIRDVLEKMDKLHCVLSKRDAEFVKALLGLLQHPYDLCIELQRRECLAAEVPPLFYALLGLLEDLQYAEDTPLDNARKAIVNTLKQKFFGDDAVMEKYLIFAFFHPAHKSLNFIPDARLRKATMDAINILYCEEIGKEVVLYTDAQRTAPAPPVPSASTATAASQRSSSVAVHHTEDAAGSSCRTRVKEKRTAIRERMEAMKRHTTETTLSEIERYLQIPVATETDPLVWWKNAEEMLPNLAKMARFYLSVPATTVENERLFSASAIVTGGRRSSTRPSVVEDMLWVKWNGQED